MSFEHLNGIMVDLETMSTAPNAAILSIGACAFDIDKNKVYDVFEINIKPQSSKEFGLDIDKDTINWWLKQKPEVLKSITKDGVQLPAALEEFTKYLKSHKGLIWCWGSNFDSPVLESSYRAIGQKQVPWRYYDVKCARTVATVFGDEIRRSETAIHNAAVDAVDQAKFLIKLFRDLQSAPDYDDDIPF